MLVRRIATIVPALAALAVAAPAAAAPTWLTPSPLSATGQDATQSQVSVNARGDATAVWVRADVIEVASRTAGGGAWLAAVKLSTGTETAEQPQVGIDAAGDGVAVWLSTEGGEERIEVATRSGIGGTWGAPVLVKKLGPQVLMPVGPDLAVDQGGDAVVVWRYKALIDAASGKAGGAFLTPETLTEHAEQMEGPQVGIDAAGEATAIWEDITSGSRKLIAASRPAAGKWLSPTTVAEPPNENVPQLAVDGRGDVVAVWERFFEETGSGTMEEHIEAATRPAGSATWGAGVSLTKTEPGIGEPGNQAVAIDGQGDAIAIWGRMHGAHETIEASQDRDAGSTWSPAAEISPPGDTVEEAPEVAIDEAGHALVVWERFNGSNDLIEAASGSAATVAWGTPVPISLTEGDAKEPEVALDAQGNAAATWSRDNGTSYIAEAAGFDAAGPALSAFVVPARGAVGETLSFSVSPFDAWSTLGATTWSFGDGASATGTSVTHAFSAPGTFKVTVSGIDGIGNVSTASATVLISVGKGGPPKIGTPQLTGAHLTNKRFRVSSKATAISAAVPRGTRFSFTLSRIARVQIAIQHSVGGLRSGKRCVASSRKLRRAHAKHCKRVLTVGTLTRGNEAAGADAVPFSGRIGRKALKPGAYTAAITATASGLKSKPAKLAFTIVH